MDTKKVYDHETGEWSEVALSSEEQQEYLNSLPTLESLKAKKNLQINQWREEANFSTFPYQGKFVAVDRLSRSDIDAVANHIALNGSFPDGFPNAWKATDNTYIMLPDVNSFKAMFSAMTAQGTANFTHSQNLKSQVAAATTEEQIGAITWASE